MLQQFNYADLTNELQTAGNFVGITPANDITVFTGNNDDAAFAAVDIPKNIIYVTFRGTYPTSLDNIKTDINVVQVSQYGGQVH